MLEVLVSKPLNTNVITRLNYKSLHHNFSNFLASLNQHTKILSIVYTNIKTTHPLRYTL